MFARLNSIAYLCSTETKNATAHAACDSNNPTGHRALPDYTETRERSGKSACLLHSYKSMYNLSNFGEYYILTLNSYEKNIFIRFAFCSINFSKRPI